MATKLAGAVVVSTDRLEGTGMRPERERDLYPRLARYAKERWHCFAMATDTGLQTARIDVVGLRHTGGKLSGGVEIVAIEVKAGNQPFATCAGQARAYGMYADRCYLAEWKEKEGFSPDEIDIAGVLGIGLLRIGSRRIDERLTAPRQAPIERFQLELLYRLGHARCTLCGSAFDLGQHGARTEAVSRSSSRGRVLQAARKGKGFVYWLEEVSVREGYEDSSGLIYARRYLCPDCVSNLFGELSGD
jgi:hypothetical protein